MIDIFELGNMQLVTVHKHLTMYQTKVEDKKIVLIARPAHEFIMTEGAAWSCPVEAIRNTRAALAAHNRL